MQSTAKDFGDLGAVRVLPMLYSGSNIYIPERLPAPGILMLHGSEGGAMGTNDYEAYALAQRGFVVITYCYYRCPGLSPSLYRIELGNTIAALQFLKDSEFVAGKPVGLFGVSRGAEQALLIASILKDTDLVNAVAVHAPSDTIVSSFDPSQQGPVLEYDRFGRRIMGPAWTMGGQSLYGETFSYEQAGPRIEIEQYEGPLLVSHGTADEVWPVERTRRIREARATVPSYRTDIHLYPGDGHVLSNENMANVMAERYDFFESTLRE